LNNLPGYPTAKVLNCYSTSIYEWVNQFHKEIQKII